MTLTAGSRLGSYEILAPLGAGGMGEVWRARDTKLGREVALKVLPLSVAQDPERLQRFEREAHLLASLNHPHIAAIHGIEDSTETKALVLELVEGPTLEERIARGPLPLEDAIAIARQIAEALEAAHERGVVHRDLKPANVKLTADGAVKVLDFGLAKALDPAGAATSSNSPTLMNSPTLTAAGTQLGVILGTAAYMAPEQARGKPTDRRADIWSFGVVLFEMLMGQRLFDGETVSDTLAGVLKTEIDTGSLPSGTPPALRRLVRRCCERDPRRRLQAIGEARVVLEDLAAGRGEETVGAPPQSAPRGGARLAWTIAAVSLAAALALGGIALLRSPRPPRLVRASVALPHGVSLASTGVHAGAVAISPDGARLAFCARQGDGVARIWVRALADAEARPLAGTDGAERPFWSPDGRTIGFFDTRSLKKIAAGGGPVQTLAPVFDSRGGTWNRDGTIVFAPNYIGGLVRVGEDGGKVEPVTQLDQTRGEFTHRYPQFLPDGRHLLFLARSAAAGGGKEPAVVLASLDGRERRVLFENASNVQYASGHILYAREHALLARPFDAGRLELGAGTRPVVADLLVDGRFSLAVFSASADGVLAFQTGQVSDASQWVWLDRAGKRLGVLDEPGQYVGAQGIALSPDGRTFAMTWVDPESGEAAIWLVDIERGTRNRFTQPGADNDSPAWAPDGSRIAWSSRDARSRRIVMKAANGTGEETTLRQSESDSLESLAGFTPDGRRLVLEQITSDGGADILELTLDGGATRPIAASPKAREGFSNLSADGRWLTYASDESGRSEVYVAAYPGPGARWQISREGGTEPRWRGDGRALLFFSADNTLTEAHIDISSDALSVGRTERLFRVRDIGNWRYAVVSDASRFLVNLPLAQDTTSPITIVTDWTIPY